MPDTTEPTYPKITKRFLVNIQVEVSVKVAEYDLDTFATSAAETAALNVLAGGEGALRYGYMFKEDVDPEWVSDDGFVMAGPYTTVNYEANIRDAEVIEI